MKKTGSEMPAAQDASPGSEGPPEIIERARLQADVAQQRVRLAKDELRRARKRLKEAKREARRARKHAALSRKNWKRARRKAKNEGPTTDESTQEARRLRRSKRTRPKGIPPGAARSKAKTAAARSRSTQSRSTRTRLSGTRTSKRGGRTSRGRKAR